MSKATREEKLELFDAKKKAMSIRSELKNGGTLLLFAFDGSGVKPVNDLLSDEQLDLVSALLTGILENVEKEITERIFEDYFSDQMNPPEDGDNESTAEKEN